MIGSTVNRMQYVGAGLTGPYAFAFRVFAATDLQVTKRSSGVETTLGYLTDFVLAAGTVVGDAAGGSITLTVALAVGEVLTIRRVVPLLQPVSLANQSAYFGSTHETEFDRLVAQVQQLDDRLRRSVGVGETYDPAGLSLLVPAGEPGKVLGWDSSTTLTNKTLDSSAVALPAAGRTTLTLSTFLGNNAPFNALDYIPAGTDRAALLAGTVSANPTLNAAIQACAQLGGGEVRVPLGRWLLTEPIIVWEGVDLVGDGEGGYGVGTFLLIGDVLCGAGTELNPPVIQMGNNSRLRRFAIKTQTQVQIRAGLIAPVIHPWAIFVGVIHGHGNGYIQIEDVRLLSLWQGIGLGCLYTAGYTGCEEVTIHRVTGWCLKTFMSVDQSVDTTWIEHVYAHPNLSLYYDNPNSAYFDLATCLSYMRTNQTIALRMRRSDWCSVINFISYGHYIGILLEWGSGNPYVGAYFGRTQASFTNCGADGAQFSLVINDCVSALFTNCWFACRRVAAEPVIGVTITSGNSSAISFHGCLFYAEISDQLINISSGVPGIPTGVSVGQVVTGGTFPAGTYYWKVTALNQTGESIASAEVSVALGLNYSAHVAWTAVAGAVGYRVYRGSASGGENVYYVLGNVTTFTDTNAAATAGVVPVQTGAPVTIAACQFLSHLRGLVASAGRITLTDNIFGFTVYGTLYDVDLSGTMVKLSGRANRRADGTALAINGLAASMIDGSFETETQVWMGRQARLNAGLYDQNGVQLIGLLRKTGWSIATGTPLRTSFNADATTTASAGYVQTEVQAVNDRLLETRRVLKALIDDLHGTAGHGLIGT